MRPTGRPIEEREEDMTWKKELKDCITTIEQLEELAPLQPETRKKLRKVIERHPMSITRYYASIVDWNDPDDPIKRMIVPSTAELDLSGIYDQSGEQQNTRMQGLQHKYRQTALILTTNMCAAFCRYCFRKRLVGLPSSEVLSRIDDAVEYIREHPEINNVLLSGGDPLYLETAMVRNMIDKLSRIEHLDFIRIGTKTPVTLPSRITGDPGLLQYLEKISRGRKRLFVSTQFNHSNELTPEARAAVEALSQAGVVTNNQTVLMRGVNDDPRTLADLQRKLTAIGAIPYYVFQCRPVKRAKKFFQVPLYEGFRTVEAARALLDGYSKRFRYVMSHRDGKISVTGLDDEYFYFRFHQARDPKKSGKFFKRRIDKKAGWLDDLPPA